ncbi:hypothetical protein GS597_13785 [Synechococcales cyanobacterium C]|uniref:Uncharacterized protein n=1 Tax=Petrachloros mirabilis ULC683 TaxID=2781853 RepID=A0A8K2A0M5_9CYAN|nr:Npun_F5560 family protein [Petrachloros mirabilis]NCJ07561.1 hypothetical protein [Petrachloros mirabilis ULC683]
MDQPPSPDVQAEVLQLRQQLELRDQLVEQLSGELFRMIRTQPLALPPGAPLSEMAALPPATPSKRHLDEVQELEQQISFYQAQIDRQDAEIRQLQISCQELRDRNQMLEQLIQDLPEVYRQQFSERLAQIRAQVQSLQQENRRLYAEIQTAHQALSGDKRSLIQRLSLPSFGANGSGKPTPDPSPD